MSFLKSTLALGATTISAFASAAPAAPLGEVAGFNIAEVVKFLPFMAIFYYFLIHQPKKRAKEHNAVLAGLSKGDKVLTTAGIIGTIHKIDANNAEATLEIADGVRIQVLKSTLNPIAATGNVVSMAAAENKKSKTV
jgi:preprotein translocase subunit YajC